jgi:hypothetical protein
MRDPQRLAQSRSARHARPEYRLTLRQADQAREDFAAIVDELDFVKGQLSQTADARTAQSDFVAQVRERMFNVGGTRVLAGGVISLRRLTQ